jgi:hypothetical protein
MKSFDHDEQRIAHNKRTIEHWAPVVTRQAIGNQVLFRKKAGWFHSAEFLRAKVDFSKPVIVCGAGPSLKETLAKITPENRDRFTIIAVDTAFHPMLRSGVIPNVVVHLDPEGNLLERTFRDNADMVRPVGDRGTVLLAPAYSHRSLLLAWIETFKRPIFLYHPLDDKNPAYKKVCEIYPEYPQYPSKPNVGQFSVDLAFHHGARVIAFAGLDLAYRGGKGYIDGVGHAGSDTPQDAAIVLLGNDMMPVSTSFVFFFDHLHFTEMLRGYLGEGVEIYNLSRGIVPLVNCLKEFFDKNG